LKAFQEILAAYYKEQKIGELWRQVQPIYNREIEKLHDPISDITFVATVSAEILEPTNPRTFRLSSSRSWAASQRAQLRRPTIVA